MQKCPNFSRFVSQKLQTHRILENCRLRRPRQIQVIKIESQRHQLVSLAVRAKGFAPLDRHILFGKQNLLRHGISNPYVTQRPFQRSFSNYNSNEWVSKHQDIGMLFFLFFPPEKTTSHVTN